MSPIHDPKPEAPPEMVGPRTVTWSEGNKRFQAVIQSDQVWLYRKLDEQAKLLQKINNSLVFFVILAILYLIFSFFRAIL